jgi:hypothetical protein
MHINEHESGRSLRVGIMTFHWAYNYGANLQAYALFQFLREALHIEVQLIDFITDRQKKVNKILPAIRWSIQMPKIFIRILLTLLYFKPLFRRKSRFEHFAQKFFSFTRHYSEFEDLRANPPEFDAVITGSDQVFNCRILSDQELSAYCLAAFSSKKTQKIAFAPSFGNDLVNSDEFSKMAKDLMDFSSLSARENSGVKLLEDMTGKQVEILFDPVFLLDADNWRKLSCSFQTSYPEYILCYALNGLSTLGDLVAKVKILTGLPIVLVTSNVRSCIKADKTVFDAGPQEFLWLIDNARYVLTDSFHGTAFANLFEKDFFTHIIVADSAQRIIGLLKRLGQESRLVNRSEDITIENLHVDFTCNRNIIIEEQKKSEIYLREALFSAIN